MNCMVRWENQGEWRGPFEVVSILPDWVRLGDVGMYSPTVPRAWTLGVDDGWTIWEGGECPVSPLSHCNVSFRDADEARDAVANGMRWDHLDCSGDIVAYRVVEQPKTLDQAWDEEEPSLSEILNDLWLDDYNVFCRVDQWDVDGGNVPFHASSAGWVSRDWFTGRRHLTADELAKEMEG